ncbi:hypothetical protein FZEAL_6245 [Fusarium zealandicum]|uniref:Uncharacterized protein n=1 Tax=Fusarium zealandicum TaxID=1053134 RepID=A0A8H4UI57_9HYPO|nr:hypothetical protein FZEAL_6245 [Fusarium zealandicum]
MLNQRFASLLWLLNVLSVVVAQDEGRTQSPKYNCLGGPAFGLEAACDFNNFEGLQGRAPSELLYEIIMQVDLPNDTFYPNEEHVTCLFKDTSFILDFEAGLRAIGFQIDIKEAGKICVFAKDIPKGGLTLGEIRVLSRALISECDKCGRMTVNYLSKKESDLGWLEFDWKKSAICQENCIRPGHGLKTENSTDSSRDRERNAYFGNGNGGSFSKGGLYERLEMAMGNGSAT